MRDIDDIDAQIEFLEAKIHDFSFSDDIQWDKKQILGFLSQLSDAHKEKHKVLIQEEKLLDTRSFGRKIWDFVKEYPDLSIFLLLVYMLIILLVVYLCLYVYIHGLVNSLKSLGEMMCGAVFWMALIGVIALFAKLKG